MSGDYLKSAISEEGLEFESDWGFRLSGGKYGIITDNSDKLRTCGNDVKCDMSFHRISHSAVEFSQSIRNVGSDTLNINEIHMFYGKIELPLAGWRVAHMELFKADRFFEGCNYYTGQLLEPVPGTEGEFGLSEDLPFPGIFFTHPERGTILMSVLSQERCKPVWTLDAEGRCCWLKAREYFSGIPHIHLPAGKQLDSERWIILHTKGGIEEAVDAYYQILSDNIDCYATESVLRRAVVWGSWNYNLRPNGHMDITHDYIVRNAEELVKMVPDRPRFVMIDDGYQYGSFERSRRPDWLCSFMGALDDSDTPPHDPKLFPEGMQGVADAIRRAGAEPAIWASPRLRAGSALAKEHSDLLLHCAGEPTFSSRMAYLDYSLPEAREYIRNAWHTLFCEWGYKAIKLDFWTLPFEIPFVDYRNKDRTAIELRNQFLKDLREFVPAEGYIITACAINGGNPFVGRYVDAVRTGTDIGNGTWNSIMNSSLHLTGVSPFVSHQCVLSDPDTVGYCPENERNANRLWATMALMTGGMLEVGGDLKNLSIEARDLIEKSIDFFAPSRRTRVGIDRFGINNTPASHLIQERDDGVYEAFLNWNSYPREFRLPGKVRDLWTGKVLSGRHKLQPQDALLYKR